MNRVIVHSVHSVQPLNNLNILNNPLIMRQGHYIFRFLHDVCLRFIKYKVSECARHFPENFRFASYFIILDCITPLNAINKGEKRNLAGLIRKELQLLITWAFLGPIILLACSAKLKNN
jgi:hypothetical protein